MCSDQVGPRFTSGGQCLERPLSTGKQLYQLQEENDKDPLYVPMTKAAAKIQVFETSQLIYHWRIQRKRG